MMCPHILRMHEGTFSLEAAHMKPISFHNLWLLIYVFIHHDAFIIKQIKQMLKRIISHDL